MKKYTFILAALFLAFSFTACSQNKVSTAVANAFAKKFPTVKKATWSKEGKTQWEAEFELNKKDMSANFDYHGNWKETETDLEVSDLTATVINTLGKQFPSYNIKEVAYTETPTSSAYEIIIKKGESKMEVTIDKTGKLLSKENANEEND